MRAVDEGCGLPQQDRKGDWMQTYSGRQYWPLDPRASEVEVGDIAHHLGMICRYCGACRRFYSVGEHSVGVLFVVSEWLDAIGHPAPRPIKLHALLHDSPEAYCHDLIRPIKRCVTGYAEVEEANAKAIAWALRLPIISGPERDLIKSADNAMLLAEQAALMAPAPAKWAPIDVPQLMLDAAGLFLRRNGTGWTPEEAKAEFLAEYEELRAA